VVKVRPGRGQPTTNAYQTLPDPVLAERTPLAILVWWAGALPNPTKILASSARRIGGFGLVAPVFTNRYQLLPTPNLALPLPSKAFTKLDLR